MCRTFPHHTAHHTPHRLHGFAPAFLVRIVRVHPQISMFSFFCPWRCLLPKGVNNYFVIMAFICIHPWQPSSHPAIQPICRSRRFTNDPAAVRLLLSPRCLSCSHPSAVLIDGLMASTRSALPHVPSLSLYMLKAQPVSHTYHQHGWMPLPVCCRGT